jgi:hypothetical protein
VDPSIELEPINETVAHNLAAERGGHVDAGDLARLILAHGPTNAAAIWLRAAWLWRQGIEEAREAA